MPEVTTNWYACPHCGSALIRKRQQGIWIYGCFSCKRLVQPVVKSSQSPEGQKESA